MEKCNVAGTEKNTDTARRDAGILYEPQKYGSSFALSLESIKYDIYKMRRINRTRYKGRGRPQKSDYDVKTVMEWLIYDMEEAVRKSMRIPEIYL